MKLDQFLSAALGSKPPGECQVQKMKDQLGLGTNDHGPTHANSNGTTAESTTNGHGPVRASNGTTEPSQGMNGEARVPGSHGVEGKPPLKHRSKSLAQAGVKSGTTKSSEATRPRKNSFSYLSLLEKNGGNFPHRTQPIIENSGSRKNSFSGSFGNIPHPHSFNSSESGMSSSWVKSQSMEYLNHTSKRNLMARSNPIGLAEPSIKRDGYAVGTDGSFYRSSEHIFSDNARHGRASSSTPDRDLGAGLASAKDRHSSLSNLSGVGIRPGAGLIATGRSSTNIHMFMPFGHSNMKKTSSNKSGNKSTSHWGASTSGSTHTSSSQTKRESQADTSATIIKQGIEEIEYLTRAAHRQDILVVNTVKHTSDESQAQTPKMLQPQPESDSSPQATEATSTRRPGKTAKRSLGGTFQAVDVMLKSTLAEAPIEFTLKRPSPRARSLSRTCQSLPDQSVTISLPASTRTSRQPSLEPETRNSSSRRTTRQQQRHKVVGGGLASSQHRSSSVEIFNGTYEMKVAHPASKRKMSAEISEIKSELYSFETSCEGQQKDDLIVVENESYPPESRTQDVQKPMEHNADQGGAPKKEVRDDKLGQCEAMTTSEPSVPCPPEFVTKRDNPLTTTIGSVGVGSALRGLTAALEDLQSQQNEQKCKLLNANQKKQRGGGKERRRKRHDSTASDVSLTVSVSLNSSRKSSRQVSPEPNSQASGGLRSRRNSMDLYSADYDMKVKKTGGQIKMRQKSSSHIQYDDITKDDLKLCSRCHSSTHSAADCSEYGDLLCPRCLEWDHWEDTCPFNDPDLPAQCNICEGEGHKSTIHHTEGFMQRRAIVDALGWEPFREWFFQRSFRSWWQINGCVGVPLYKLYRRKTDWRTVIQPILPHEIDDEMSDFGRALVDAEDERRPRSKKNYALVKDDSIEELIKSVRSPRPRPTISTDEDIESGRSTPEHLKKFSGSAEDATSTDPVLEKRARTFSDTLKLLDEDILAELNIDK